MTQDVDAFLEHYGVTKEEENATSSDVIDFIEHYGVKGMKWGVRKSTSSGRRPKSKPETPQGKKKPQAPQAKKGSASPAKRPLTDEELRRAINRIRMEQEYRQLTAPKKSAGRQAAEQVIGNIGKQAVTTVGTALATKVLKDVVKDAFKIDLSPPPPTPPKEKKKD